jgi:hypothetical protein
MLGENPSVQRLVDSVGVVDPDGLRSGGRLGLVDGAR